MPGPLSKRQIAWIAIGALFFLLLVLVVVLAHRDRTLRVSFLDVGQGDAILVEGPTGIDMLVDGGRDRSVLRELPKKMGILDRSIDIVVATHPDADHISGLADVLERYSVSYVIEPGVESDTGPSRRFESAIAAEPRVERVLARSGQRLLLGGGAYADILYPSQDVSNIETNDGSIVMRIVYGDTEFLLTGDAPTWVEDQVAADSIRSDVLKAGHHGSRTSTSAFFLSKVQPSVVIVSAGKDNPYGHPHADVLERITAAGAQILSTIQEGSIEFESDGITIREK